MINVLLYELKSNVKTILTFFVILLGMTLVFMGFYTIFAEDISGFVEFIDRFPPAMKSLFGINTVLFTTPMGYFTFVYSTLSIVIAIQSIYLGLNVHTKEISDKSGEFIFTKPISRQNLFYMKNLAVWGALMLSGLLYLFIVGFSIHSYNPDVWHFASFIRIGVSFLMMQTVFMSIGVAISQLPIRIKTPLPVASGVSAIFYGLSAFAVSQNDDKLRYLTPFEYNRIDILIVERAFETQFILLSVALVVLFIALARYRYINRDIHMT